jgi:hypothetical protein
MYIMGTLHAARQRGAEARYLPKIASGELRCRPSASQSRRRLRHDADQLRTRGPCAPATLTSITGQDGSGPSRLAATPTCAPSPRPHTLSISISRRLRRTPLPPATKHHPSPYPRHTPRHNLKRATLPLTHHSAVYHLSHPRGHYTHLPHLSLPPEPTHTQDSSLIHLTTQQTTSLLTTHTNTRPITLTNPAFTSVKLPRTILSPTTLSRSRSEANRKNLLHPI